MRTIDADALMADLEKWLRQIDPTHPSEDNAIPPMEDIIVSTLMTIEEQPTIEPQRIRGRWVGVDYDGYADGNPVYYTWKCSMCNCLVEDEEPTWDYCPNCGADMRGGQDVNH